MNQATKVVRQGIEILSRAGLPDAKELVARAAGKHNLQAHERHLVPLAALFLSKRPRIREELVTVPLRREGSKAIWEDVKTAFVQYVSANGGTIVSKTIKSGNTLSARKVTNTYLPISWGGSQPHGGGGISTLKRALKLGAHILDVFETE
jgi:hypothetical protein